MEINVFTYGYIADLLRNVKDRHDFNPYYLDAFPFEDNYPKGHSGISIPDNFELIKSENSKHFDLDNSILLFENLAGITPAVASDARLWTYLTHVVFWKYMRNRWPVENANEKDGPQGRIVARYFLNNSNLQSLTRNGISRLWWYAYLTVDESNVDKYELTRILLERQEIVVGLLERALGADASVRTAVLKFLQRNDDVRKNEDKTRIFYKLMNLSGGVRNLPGLKDSELLKLFEKIHKEIM